MIVLSLFKGGYIEVAVLINEQIKADEVVLTGLSGEKLGVVSKSEAWLWPDPREWTWSAPH